MKKLIFIFVLLMAMDAGAGSFGGEAKTGDDFVLSEDFKFSCAYVCDSTGTADSLHVTANHGSNDVDTIILFIYRDSGDFGGTAIIPGPLLVFSDTLEITNVPPYQDYSIPITASLIAGKTYWLGLINIGDNSVNIDSEDSVGNIAAYNSDDENLSDPYGALTGYFDDWLSIWCTYTTEGGTTMTLGIGKALLGKGTF